MNNKEANRIEEEYIIKIALNGIVGIKAEQYKWKQVSAQQLLTAYSNDEPEYTMNMLNEPNPAFAK